MGWPELVDQVEAVYESIPGELRSDAVVLTSSYGEAGAIDVLGPDVGLPNSYSGHNNYFLWGPPDQHGPIVGVGLVGYALDLVCPDYRQVDTITNSSGVENEENGLPIYLCMNPSGQLSDVWDQVKHYN